MVIGLLKLVPALAPLLASDIDLDLMIVDLQLISLDNIVQLISECDKLLLNNVVILLMVTNFVLFGIIDLVIGFGSFCLHVFHSIYLLLLPPSWFSSLLICCTLT